MKHTFLNRWADYKPLTTIFLLEVFGVLIFSIGLDEASVVIGFFNFGVEFPRGKE